MRHGLLIKETRKNRGEKFCGVQKINSPNRRNVQCGTLFTAQNFMEKLSQHERIQSVNLFACYEIIDTNHDNDVSPLKMDLSLNLIVYRAEHWLEERPVTF